MICYILISQTESQETDNDIVGLDGKRISGYADTVAGSSLTGNGYITIIYTKCRIQKYGSRYIENNRTPSLLLNSPTQGALSAIIKIGNMVNCTATATRHISTETLSPGKCGEIFGPGCRYCCNHTENK